MASVDGRWRSIVVVVAIVVTSACGSGDATADREPSPSPTGSSSSSSSPVSPSTTTSTASTSTTSTSTSTSTTTTPTSTTTTEAPEPLRVLLAGDSLMIDTGPAALDALGSAAEPVDARVELFPSIPRTDEQEAEWRDLVEAVDPDVLVVFIGTWEGAVAFAADEPPVGEPGFEARYRQAVLAPWFDHLGERGVHTIFVGSAPMPVPLADTRIRATVEAAEAEAADRADVDFVRATTVLGDENGDWVEFLPDPRTGTLERIRRLRDVHLCTDGVERVVDLVLERLDLVADLTVDDEWRDGAWRTEGLPYDPVAGCPPP